MDFTPSIYEHAAALIGRTPWEVSRDADLMFGAHAEAYHLYCHRPVVVGIDVYNLEAEAYGVPIKKPGGVGSPAPGTPVARAAEDVARLAPLDVSAGRIPMVLDVGERLARELPDADVRVPVSGPFSVAVGLMGVEALLCDVAATPQEAARALRHLVEGQVGFCRAVRERGLDIAFFESAAAPPLLSPALFRTVELPALAEAMERAADVVGHPVPCIIGGDTTPILDGILSTGTGYVICPAETDQAAFMAAMRGRADVTVRINTRPEVIVRGDWQEIRAEADRVLALAVGRPNTCIGTGALPYEADPETVLRLGEYVAARER